jgi:hypothetical protein
LLYTIRLECWVNQSLPTSPGELAQVLGLPVSQVTNSLPALATFLTESDGWLRCPELDNYRAHLDDRKQRQSEGGKAGAAIVNGKRKSRKATPAPSPTSNPASNAQGARRGQDESLVQQCSDQYSKKQLTVVDLTTPAWTDDDSGCSAAEYAAIRG